MKDFFKEKSVVHLFEVKQYLEKAPSIAYFEYLSKFELEYAVLFLMRALYIIFDFCCLRLKTLN
jgi:hypothetical protein